MDPRIAKLGHLALVTPNLEKSLWFFRDVVGLDEVASDDQCVYLRAWGEFEHHSLSLREGPTGIDHYGWRAGRPEDVEGFAQRLSADGVEVTRVAAGTELGQGDAIRFLTPSGHPFEIYFDIDKPQAQERARTRLRSNSASKWRQGMSPRRFDHINVSTVRDEIQPVTEWLNKSLGFQLREFVRPTGREIAASWMAVTSQVHDIALSRDFGNQRARLHHFAYEFDSFQDVFRAADIVRDQGLAIEIGPGMHGITQALFCYVRDPGSDHRLELFSGAYHVFDPDWEPVEWTEHDVADGMCWWGPDWKPGNGHSMDETLPGGLEPSA